MYDVINGDKAGGLPPDPKLDAPRRRRFSGPPSGLSAAVDLGTNNCRLLVARSDGADFAIIDSFSRIVRLGEGLSQAGQLSATAMDRAVAALRVCAQKIDRHKVATVRCVATHACRSAANADEFVARVKQETGLGLEIISPEEEAVLAVWGCRSLFDPVSERALVFDIGGGSTGISWTGLGVDGAPDIIDWMSLPLGVVSVSEWLGNRTLTPQLFERTSRDLVHYLSGFDARNMIAGKIGNRRVQMVGTSGTVTTLASLQLNLKHYHRERVDGAWLDTAALRQKALKVATMPYEKRIQLACIGVERADLVVAGCIILDAIIARWPVKRLRVADRGIREGILRCMDPARLANG